VVNRGIAVAIYPLTRSLQDNMRVVRSLVVIQDPISTVASDTSFCRQNDKVINTFIVFEPTFNLCFMSFLSDSSCTPTHIDPSKQLDGVGSVFTLDSPCEIVADNKVEK
jgi:hypothetical protein